MRSLLYRTNEETLLTSALYGQYHNIEGVEREYHFEISISQ